MDNKKNLTRGRKRGRFNLVDLFLVLLILVIVSMLFVMFDPFSLGAADAKDVTLRYTIEIKDVSEEFRNNVKVGDRVLSAATDYDMGTVVTVDQSQKSFEWAYAEGDEFMSKSEKADKFDLKITIDVGATYEEGVGYMVDGKHVAVGSLVSLRFPSFTGSGYCISIEEAN